MNYNRVIRSRYFSGSASVVVHLLLFLLLLLLHLGTSTPPADPFVEIGFGDGTGFGSPGAPGNELEGVPEELTRDESSASEEERERENDLPNLKNETDEDRLPEPDKKKEKEKASDKDKTRKEREAAEKKRGNQTKGDGILGLDDLLGGGLQRKLIEYDIPPYPEGVSKEADVTMQFTIQPDGTVSNIRILKKADGRLESTARDALRRWRFERLRSTQPQIGQNVKIIFPFRLR